MSPMKFEDPMWVAGVIATIGALGLMGKGLIEQFKTNRKLDENTAVTTAVHQKSEVIEKLVNGTQTKLLAELQASKEALDMTHGEIRGLHELIGKLVPMVPQVAAAVAPLAAIQQSTQQSAEATAASAETLARIRDERDKP